MHYFCLLLIMFLRFDLSSGQAKPAIRCLSYVPENKGTSCWCERPEHVKANVTLWWPGHSDTNELKLNSVRRKDNGTEYDCSMRGDGGTSSAVYTLRVAYGPLDRDLAVGPSEIVTTGSHLVNLMCHAINTYPTPRYLWSGIACENTVPGNTCTLTPDPSRNDKYHHVCTVPEDTCSFKPNPASDHGRYVACTASMRLWTNDTYWQHNLLQANAKMHLNLFYPPPDRPVIQPQPSEHHLQPGDNLTCTVTGGHPPVSSVNFYCMNPHLLDKDDEIRGTSVKSSVTVGFTDNTLKNVKCFCEANWTKKPEYYQYIATVVYNAQENKGYDPSGFVTGLFAVPAYAIVIVIIVVIRRRVDNRLHADATRNRHELVDNVEVSEASEDSNSNVYVDVDDDSTSEEGQDLLQNRRSYHVSEHESEASDSTEDTSSETYMDVDRQSNSEEQQQPRRPPSQLPAAGIPLSCLCQGDHGLSDPDQQEETEMSVSGAMPSSRDDYAATRETGSEDNYMYTPLEMPAPAVYINCPLGDDVDSDCSQDDYYLHAVYGGSSNRPVSPDDYCLRVLFDSSDDPTC